MPARFRTIRTTRLAALRVLTLSGVNLAHAGVDQTFKLTANDGESGDNFGSSVALSGETALVGVTGDDDDLRGRDAGSAYLFDATTGQQIAKLTPSNRTPNDRFGSYVALSGDIALIGDIFGNGSGSAYLFGADELTETPIAGASFEFTVDENQAATLDGVLTLTNTGDPGSVVNVTGYTITGDDAALFDVLDFAAAALLAGDETQDSVSFDLAFLGTPIGDDQATLTIQTDSGDVVYELSAVVPEPAAGLVLFAGAGGLLRRRRSGWRG